jgi:hypothetical protein
MERSAQGGSASKPTVFIHTNYKQLIGARVSHCYGHHFSEPATRLAFQIALARANPTPGTMVYGNTTSYRGDAAANYASLASYLLVDVLAQARNPSGHAVNPVPVSENRRIPEVDEIVDAQLFADRLIAQAADHGPLLDPGEAEALADRLLTGGETFRDRTLSRASPRPASPPTTRWS